jgi:multisubunit Na+/H+ antiporter MnhB subunit
MRDVVDRLERFQRSCRMTRISRIAVAVAALSTPLALDMVSAAAPGFVDITWMSISNMYYEVGPLNVVTDGYITRLPIENLNRR